ncbi:SDR family NAD(P)-dependent oxidoreductase [Labedella endophytica]|uniref:SDR family NAD(P)-dependent oxidoreductase n=1 Tax=Labedella endophytica TaxID=1523160 RepID=A0A3S0WVM7_9MICO|nr:SDR family NAD(P)-dependent oxidoreductase [Labedella endophytica]RUQ98153.1 SDR family NAD(P)-dependent oxidoreductase [Labedella endophytica]
MNLNGATALVTGTSRGLGRSLALELVRRGATVYATARQPDDVDVPGSTVLRLDITDKRSVAEAAAVATDVDLLVNNAALTAIANLVDGDLDVIRKLMDSHFFGTLAMVRAFAPVLARNGGGAILNVLSSTAWTSVHGNSALAAAKSAEWGLTNGVRVELAPQGTHVAAFLPTLVGSDTLTDALRSAGLVLPDDVMTDPAELAALALDGLEADELEIVDPLGAEAKASLSGPPRALDLASLARS